MIATALTRLVPALFLGRIHPNEPVAQLDRNQTPWTKSHSMGEAYSPPRGSQARFTHFPRAGP